MAKGQADGTQQHRHKRDRVEPVVAVAVRNLVAADNKDLGVAAKAEPAPAVI